jgi:MFS family permease
MPLTGHLSEWLGRRRLLAAGFVASSALCGMSWNLASMVLFRLAQGICGAPPRAVFRRGLFHARVGQRRQHRRSVAA